MSRKRIGLCVGVEYWLYADSGIADVLPGCHRDAKHMYDLLTKKYHFDQVVLMIDDSSTVPALQPTKANILTQLALLADQSENADVVFTYAGHGSQLRDAPTFSSSSSQNVNPGDEPDGLDETIVPLDYMGSPSTGTGGGQIRDDELKKVLVEHLKPTARFVGIFDSCHSGSILDLPFIYNLSKARVGTNTVSLLETPQPSVVDYPCPVLTLSGCKDDQTSMSAYDVSNSGVKLTSSTGAQVAYTRENTGRGTAPDLWQGAMSWALLTVLETLGYNLTWPLVFRGVREALAQKGYDQLPMLASSHKLSDDPQASSETVFVIWEKDAKVTNDPLPRGSFNSLQAINNK
jgi:hypothetical protein